MVQLLFKERILFTVHNAEWKDMKFKQHWKCGKCTAEYYSTVKANAVTCKNGHKMKVVEEKDKDE